MATSESANVSFNMTREGMADFPIYTLPPGYRFRAYRPGDADHWTALHLAAEPYIPVTPELFVRQFGDDLDALPDRMFFVETNRGEVAGSITAWWERQRHNPDERGRIHWVVVHPAHQRRGLAKPMMTHAMRRLAQSHSQAMLGTSSARIWALKVYLDFGFHPDPAQLGDERIHQAWRHVQSVLHHPLLATWIDKFLDRE
jgi:ribosomal protein S18 acetylase RimI-like enzyme